MDDAIEVEIVFLPGGVASSDMRMLASMRLTLLDDGYRIYVYSGEDEAFWESRGFLAADVEDIWRLIQKAAAWAAHEWEKRS